MLVRQASTQAALKVPSAKIARKWLGNLNATKKASAIGPAPSTAASTMSRAKPVSRESSVRPPTVKKRPIIGRASRRPRRGRLRSADHAPRRATPDGRHCTGFETPDRDLQARYALIAGDRGLLAGAYC